MVDVTINPSYKQTDIGILPIDWEVDEIQNHASITTGKKNTQDRIKDGKYPFFVRSQIVEKINTFSYDGEAVLTAGDGVGTGKVFHYINGKFDFHQRVYKISNFDDRLDGYFFYLYFSNNFLERIMSMTAKSSVDSVRMDMISEMKVPLPDKKEQIKIFEVIRDTYILINNLEKLIEKKKNIKIGLMQDLLTGKKRLPSFSEEWTNVTLGSIGSFYKGKGLAKKDIQSSGKYPAIPYTSIYTDFETVIKYDQINNFTSSTNVVIINSPHILIASSSNMLENIGKTTAYNYHKEVAIGGDILIYKTESNICFLSYLLNTKFHRNKIILLSQGSTIRHVYSSTFQKYEINLPSIEEQNEIVNIFMNIDLEINELKKERSKYLLILKGMMQYLLTGRIRL